LAAGCGSAADHEARVTGTEAPTPVVTSLTGSVDLALPAAASRTIHVNAPVDRDLLRLVSRQHALGEEYVPPDLVTLPSALVVPGYPPRQLRREAADALAALVAAGARDGVELRVASAYRSFEEQVVVHQRHVDRRGAEEASRRSAPPGYSEHQLGTTVDITARSVDWRLTHRLADAPEGQWLAEHAYEYGFALSYPEGAEAMTGYVYEPWHLGYVGHDHAIAWRQSGLTLIEYLKGLSLP